jgi:hypothetical protein
MRHEAGQEGDEEDADLRVEQIGRQPGEIAPTERAAARRRCQLTRSRPQRLHAQPDQVCGARHAQDVVAGMAGPQQRRQTERRSDNPHRQAGQHTGHRAHRLGRTAAQQRPDHDQGVRSG